MKSIHEIPDLVDGAESQLDPDVYQLLVRRLARSFVAAWHLQEALDDIKSSGEEGNPDAEASAALYRKQLES